MQQTLEQRIKWLLDRYNKMFAGMRVCPGSIAIETDRDVIVNQCHCPPQDYKPGYVAVTYDFMDDELTEVETMIFQAVYENMWDNLQRLFHQVYDIDGSGGGLYYGLTVFRP